MILDGNYTLSERELALEFYGTMRKIRMFSEAAAEMYRKGKIRGYLHSYMGEEAIATGVCAALRKSDYVISTHRGHGHFIAKGSDLKAIMAELFGKSTGLSMGRGGSMHLTDPSNGLLITSAIVGGGIPVAAGVAMGIKLEKSDKVAVCFLGDGAANNGVFGESLNLAALYSLPVIYIIENNRYAATTHLTKGTVCTELCERAAGFGVPGESVFGNDPFMIFERVREAVDRARSGKGPSVIEAKTYRMLGHHINDPGYYMPEDEKREWADKDPLNLILGRLKDEFGIDDSEISKINSEIDNEILSAVEFAENSPMPYAESLIDDIKIYD